MRGSYRDVNDCMLASGAMMMKSAEHLVSFNEGSFSDMWSAALREHQKIMKEMIQFLWSDVKIPPLIIKSS